MDKTGHYWIAMQEGAQVVRLSPTGEMVDRLEAPVGCPTDVCFGGPDGATLYLTSRRLHRSAEEIARYPDSGGVFALPTNASGLPTGMYWD